MRTNSTSISEIHVSHSAFNQVPIIAMTGDSAESVLDTCRKKGMNGCIGKPPQRDRLMAAVKEWTDTEPKFLNNESKKWVRWRNNFNN